MKAKKISIAKIDLFANNKLFPADPKNAAATPETAAKTTQLSSVESQPPSPSLSIMVESSTTPPESTSEL